MSRYLTPQQYRTKGDLLVGPTSQNWQDWQLDELISRAEAAIDAYMAFPLRHPSGFAPGVLGLVQEGFDFTTRKVTLPMPPVPTRNIQRVRVHISNVGSTLPLGGASTTAQGLYANLNPGEVIINNDEGYGESISLTLTYSLASVVWELGAQPPILEWDVEIGHYLPYYGKPLYNINGDNVTYRALRGFWASVYTQDASILPNQLPPVPPRLYKNGVPINSTLLLTALTAGTAYTSLNVAPLPQAASSGQSFTLNGSTGLTPGSIIPSLTVTLSAPALAGAQTLSIQSVTPQVNYPAASVPNWYAANMTQQNLPYGGNLNGTFLTQGCAIDYDEGVVSFYNSGTPSSPVANAKTDVIKADYTAQVPDLAAEATTAQVTYLIQQANLNQMGMGGLELIRNGQQQARRAKSDDAEEDQLCAKARLKLARYASVALA